MLVFGLLLGLFSASDAFRMSMVSSSTPPSRSFGSLKTSSTSASKRVSVLGDPFATAAKLAGSFNLSSGLISQLAIVALKARLADHQTVDCHVSANPTDLLFGRVGPVTVRGRSWKSGLGLTCRAIEASVESCELDPRRIWKDQKLVLTEPAKGTAMIALNAEDFGNFITHPRMQPPKVESLPYAKVQFLRQDTTIDASTGVVSFITQVDGARYRCLLKRKVNSQSSQSNALVTVVPENADDAVAGYLENALGRFFNDMVFQLDGTYLSFRDLMVTGKGSSPSIMLSLGICVHKFPSRDLAF